MLTILKFTISGYNSLKDETIIDFVTKERIDERDDNDEEIIKVAKNLYTYKLMGIVGSNASGKTTLIKLLTKIFTFIKTGRWINDINDFKKDKINLGIEFFKDGYIYLYNVDILKESSTDDLYLLNPYSNIDNESIKRAEYQPKAGKNYLNDLKFNEIEIPFKNSDTSILKSLCEKELFIYGEFDKDERNLEKRSFFKAINLTDKDLIGPIIRIFDESIEYITPNMDGSITMKRYKESPKNYTKVELLDVLSDGTIKGVELISKVISLLNTGGVLLIDEIENSFNKSVVNNIFYLLESQKSNNNNGSLIFTTNYVEVLDSLGRRDNIFITNKVKNVINISNLYDNYDVRSETKKSKQFSDNVFKTNLNFKALTELKTLLQERKK